MKWYYSDNNERRGPIDDADLTALAIAGTIQPDTLVWHEGMAEWQPYSQVAVGARSEAGRCSQCGRAFPPDEMITYEGQAVCAECKPLFFQRVKEGASVAGQREYGGFWIRVAAKVVDAIVQNVIAKAVGFALVLGLGSGNATTAVSVAAAILISAGYVIFFVGKFGATPGKMACKLQIIRADGSPMTYGLATGRYFAELVSGLTLGIGYLMAAFDEEKRTLHDRICGTRVVRKR